MSAIARSIYPEDMVDGVPPDVAAAFEADELERTLCLDWLGLLLNVLAPRAGVTTTLEFYVGRPTLDEVAMALRGVGYDDERPVRRVA